MKIIIAAMFFLFVLTSNTYAVTRNWDSGGDHHTWTDPLNWDCNCLPGVGDYAVLLTNDSIAIPMGAMVHVDEILHYGELYLASGAILTVDNKIRFLDQGDFVNDGTINIHGEGLYVNDSRAIINNGTINFLGSIGASVILDAYGTDSISFINNGLLNWNNTPDGFFEKFGKTGFVNQLSGAIVFDLESNYINNLGGTFNNFGYIGNKGRILNAGNYTNHTTGNINFANINNGGIINNGTFDNNGFINIGNEGLQYCLENNFIWSGIGSLEINGKNIAQNTHIMSLDGPVVLDADIAYNGLVNNGDLFLRGTDYNAQLNCRWSNLTGKYIFIDTCKNVIQNGPFINQGTLNNHGIYRLTHNSVPTLGDFINYGIFYSNIDLIGFPPPSMPDPSENYSIHVKKIEGQHCEDTPITNIFTGDLVYINQAPSGIFIDAALTISAGTLDFTNKTFTPNATCHNISTLYISLNRNTCYPEVFELHFTNPIYSPKTYFADVDFDGFGDADSTIFVACGPIPFGFAVSNTDCDDANPDVYPGAPEICSDKDYNCDGTITGTNPAPTWYKDEDYDGYGNALLSIINCNPVVGYVGNDDDCNDSDAFIHPLALEACNNIDDDCDGLTDEDFPTTIATFNGSVSTDWFDPMNWTPNVIPGYCVDAVIPSGLTVLVEKTPPPMELPDHAICRSLTIATSSTVTVINPLDINGGTSFGISNSGILNLINDSYTNIQYIEGNGVENNGILNMSNNAILYISTTSGSSIRNFSGATLSIGENNGLDMNAADENAIFNSGIIDRNGFFNANNITGSVIKNEGTFNNNGDLFANAFGLPSWFIENLSGGIFQNTASSIIAFPIPGTFYNVSNLGVINHGGSTFHNYGTLRFFGHHISGTGAFVNHVGGLIEGCDPMGGCP